MWGFGQGEGGRFSLETFVVVDVLIFIYIYLAALDLSCHMWDLVP